jgi:hypothetical protein
MQLPPSRPPHGRTAVSVAAGEQKLNAILDGQSVGAGYGMGAWAGRGVELAFSYFRARGHEVLVVLPAETIAGAAPGCRAALDRIRAADADALQTQPDSSSPHADLLMHAVSAEESDGTPTVLVSNHPFYAEVAMHDEHAAQVADACRTYLARYRVTFSWHGDEFIPAPPPGMLGT